MRVLAIFMSAALAFADAALAGPPEGRGHSWSGCYAGANIGGGWARENVSISGSVVGNQAPVAGALGGNTAIGGFYGGCNWQFAPTWVLGVEGDFSWTQLKDATSAPNLFANGNPVGAGGINWSRNTDRLGSVRGRLGYAVSPGVLLFGTGGVAWEHSAYSGLNTGSVASRSTAFDQTLGGYVIGGGLDWTPNRDRWIVRLEYLHYEFKGTSSTVFFPNPNTFYWGRNSVDSLRAGVSYKF